jgi:hypothetical protein
MDHIRRGMPDSGLELDKSLRKYHRFCHKFHVVDGVLLYRDPIVVPVNQGPDRNPRQSPWVLGMAGWINETVFWPGIIADLIKTRGGFMTCVREAPSQPAVFPVSMPSPDYPFQMIVADYFSLHGHNFLVIV